MKLYRIAACKYIEDLSGTGAFLRGARWNSQGVRVLYTAESSALAMLEALAHITMISVKQPFCLLRLQVPEDVEVLNVDHLPANWHQRPEPDSVKTFGDDFVRRGKHLSLKVPSVLVPENYNYLINPMHPLMREVKQEAIMRISFDKALLERR